MIGWIPKAVVGRRKEGGWGNDKVTFWLMKYFIRLISRQGTCINWADVLFSVWNFCSRSRWKNSKAGRDLGVVLLRARSGCRAQFVIVNFVPAEVAAKIQ